LEQLLRSCRAAFAHKAAATARRLRLGHATAPAGMRSERLEFLASGVSAEKEIKTTWRRNASDQDVQNAS